MLKVFLVGREMEEKEFRGSLVSPSGSDCSTAGILNSVGCLESCEQKMGMAVLCNLQWV